MVFPVKTVVANSQAMPLENNNNRLCKCANACRSASIRHHTLPAGPLQATGLACVLAPGCSLNALPVVMSFHNHLFSTCAQLIGAHGFSGSGAFLGLGDGYYVGIG